MRLFTYLVPFIQGCWDPCDGTIQLDILTQIDFFLHRIYFSSWRTCNQEMIEISMITNIHTIARKGGECGNWLLMLVRCRFFFVDEKKCAWNWNSQVSKIFEFQFEEIVVQYLYSYTFKVHCLELVPKYEKLEYTIRQYLFKVHFRILNLFVSPNTLKSWTLV